MDESTTTTDVTEVVDTYLAMWDETDPTARAALIARAWGADGHYVDPLQEATGHAALSDMAAGIQAHYPQHTFRRTSGVDVHHDRLRFDWELVGPDGTVVVAGLDVGELDGESRLAAITGFFGPVPALDAA